MYIKDIDITTQEKRVKNFSELLRDPKWNEDTHRFVTYISDNTNNEIQSELLTRLINDGVHFIGWGNGENKGQIQEIIKLNDGQGTYISNKDYDKALEKTAKYIKEELDSLSKNDY